MSKKKSTLFPPVTDRELLDKSFFYFNNLRLVLPSARLKDACSGILALIFELSFFLEEHNIDDYGNHEK